MQNRNAFKWLCKTLSKHEDCVKSMSKQPKRKATQLIKWHFNDTLEFCKGNMIQSHFTLDFSLTIQRKQKDKSQVPRRVTPCMQTPFQPRRGNCDTYAHLISLFLWKPLITSKSLSHYETQHTFHKEWRKQNTQSLIAQTFMYRTYGAM